MEVVAEATTTALIALIATTIAPLGVIVTMIAPSGPIETITVIKIITKMIRANDGLISDRSHGTIPVINRSGGYSRRY